MSANMSTPNGTCMKNHIKTLSNMSAAIAVSSERFRNQMKDFRSHLDVLSREFNLIETNYAILIDDVLTLNTQLKKLLPDNSETTVDSTSSMAVQKESTGNEITMTYEEFSPSIFEDNFKSDAQACANMTNPDTTDNGSNKTAMSETASTIDIAEPEPTIIDTIDTMDKDQNQVEIAHISDDENDSNRPGNYDLNTSENEAKKKLLEMADDEYAMEDIAIDQQPMIVANGLEMSVQNETGKKSTKPATQSAEIKLSLNLLNEKSDQDIDTQEMSQLIKKDCKIVVKRLHWNDLDEHIRLGESTVKVESPPTEMNDVDADDEDVDEETRYVNRLCDLENILNPSQAKNQPKTNGPVKKSAPKKDIFDDSLDHIDDDDDDNQNDNDDDSNHQSPIKPELSESEKQAKFMLLKSLNQFMDEKQHSDSDTDASSSIFSSDSEPEDDRVQKNKKADKPKENKDNEMNEPVTMDIEPDAEPVKKKPAETIHPELTIRGLGKLISDDEEDPIKTNKTKQPKETNEMSDMEAGDKTSDSEYASVTSESPADFPDTTSLAAAEPTAEPTVEPAADVAAEEVAILDHPINGIDEHTASSVEQNDQKKKTPEKSNSLNEEEDDDEIVSPSRRIRNHMKNKATTLESSDSEREEKKPDIKKSPVDNDEDKKNKKKKMDDDDDSDKQTIVLSSSDDETIRESSRVKPRSSLLKGIYVSEAQSSKNLLSNSSKAKINIKDDNIDEDEEQVDRDSDDTLNKSDKDDDEDVDDDDDILISKNHKRKRVKIESSSTESSKYTNSDDSDYKENTKRKKELEKKRKSIINSSTDEDDDLIELDMGFSDNESDDKKTDKKDDDKETPSKSKGKLRKILKDDKLTVETQNALQAEKERKKRIEEKKKLEEEALLIPKEASNEVKEIYLDIDSKTKKPLIPIDPQLLKYIKPHQIEGVKFIWDSCFEKVELIKQGNKGSGCILAHCMGLGKTFQLITLIHTVMAHSELTTIKRVLVLMPINVLKNWNKEISDWTKKCTYQLKVYEIPNEKGADRDVVRARERVLKRWFEDGGVLLTGYTLFSRLVQGKSIKPKKYVPIFQQYLTSPGPDMVVCDEGHMLKTETSGISKTVSQIETKRRIVLTGTPLQNNLVEYHCMVSFVKPNLLGTLKEFNNRFANPINRGQHKDSSAADIIYAKKRAHVLHNLLDNCIQRKDYSVIQNLLMPKYEYVISVRLSEKQIELYRKYLNKQNISENVEMGKLVGCQIFADFHELYRIWTHPWCMKLFEIKQIRNEERQAEKKFIKGSDESDSAMSDSSSNVEVKSESNDVDDPIAAAAAASANQIDDDDDDIMEIEITEKKKKAKKNSDTNGENANEAKQRWWKDLLDEDMIFDPLQSGKLVILGQILQMCKEKADKLLVFSQTLTSLDLIEKYLEYLTDKKIDRWVKDVDYYRMDGQTDLIKRKRHVDNFNSASNKRCRLFLISTRAGGIGINLVGANRCVVFDASWNPSYDTQSIFRIYRFGQTKNVYVYRLLAQGTMEEKIYQRQVTKQSLAQRVIDEHQLDRHFTSSELRELYSFEPDTTSNIVYNIPGDDLLKSLLVDCKKWIYKYHEHDSLLENKVNESLSEAERKAAWEEYELERTRGPNWMASQRYNESFNVNNPNADNPNQIFENILAGIAANSSASMSNPNIRQLNEANMRNQYMDQQKRFEQMQMQLLQAQRQQQQQQQQYQQQQQPYQAQNVNRPPYQNPNQYSPMNNMNNNINTAQAVPQATPNNRPYNNMNNNYTRGVDPNFPTHYGPAYPNQYQQPGYNTNYPPRMPNASSSYPRLEQALEKPINNGAMPGGLSHNNQSTGNLLNQHTRKVISQTYNNNLRKVSPLNPNNNTNIAQLPQQQQQQQPTTSQFNINERVHPSPTRGKSPNINNTSMQTPITIFDDNDAEIIS